MNIDKIIKVKTARWIARRYLRKRIKGLKQIKNKIVLLNVPSHGNLGDHLISLAEQTLLKDITGEYPIVFTSGELYYGLDLIESYIQRHHTVLITGGGYLGSIWPEEEIRVQNIVKNIKDNKIIILPQTIFYEDTEDSEILIRETSRIFSYHNNLKIFTREKASYKVLTETLKLNDDKIGLLPDMGLYLNLCSNQERNGILYCLRKDKEQIDNYDIICDLKRLLQRFVKILN